MTNLKENSNIDFLPDAFKKEVKVAGSGVGYISKKGLGRLAGVSPRSWGRGGSIFTDKVDQSITAKGFEGGSIISENGVTDIIATIVLEHYAFDAGQRCTEAARNIFRLLANTGLRQMIHFAAGWKPAEAIASPEPEKKFTCPRTIEDALDIIWLQKDEIHRLMLALNSKKFTRCPSILALLPTANYAIALSLVLDAIAPMP
jgi:hypothetical protein